MRYLKTLVLLLLPLAAFSQINTNTNFDPAVAAPIDVRDTLTTLADTSGINYKFAGLWTYVSAIDKFYYYNGTAFTEFTAGISQAALNDSTAAIRADFPSGGSTTSLEADSITVTASGNLTSTDAQSALEELQGDIDGLSVGGVANGDKGDITVTNSGGTWTIDKDASIAIHETTRTSTYSSNAVSGSIYGDYDTYINNAERFPLELTVNTNGAGTVRINYMIFNGSTAAIRKTQDEVVSSGANTITIDTTGLSLSDTSMYIGLERVSGNVVAYRSASGEGDAFFVNSSTLVVSNSVNLEFNYTVKWRHKEGLLAGLHGISGELEATLDTVDAKIDDIAPYTGEYSESVTWSHTYINTLFSTFDVVTLPADTITITGAIVVPEGKTLRGVGPGSVLKTTETTINCIRIENSNITLEDFVILGNGSLDYSSTSLINSQADIESRNGEGGQVGIYVTGNHEIIINSVRFHDLTGAGIRVNNSVGGTLYRGAVTVSDCQFIKNYIGVDLYSTGEYNSISNCRINQNIIGIWGESGNNYFSNCIVTTNRVGFVCGGRATEGSNNSHSSVTGCSFNHNEYIAIYGFDFDFGYFFSNCQIWGTASGDGVLMNDCLGFVWAGGYISRDLSFLGSGTAFISHARHSSANTVTTSGTATYDGKNNSELDGTTSGSMNN